MSKYKEELSPYEKESIKDFVTGLEPNEREYLIQQLFEHPEVRHQVNGIAAGENMRGW